MKKQMVSAQTDQPGPRAGEKAQKYYKSQRIQLRRTPAQDQRGSVKQRRWPAKAGAGLPARTSYNIFLAGASSSERGSKVERGLASGLPEEKANKISKNNFEKAGHRFTDQNETRSDPTSRPRDDIMGLMQGELEQPRKDQCAEAHGRPITLSIPTKKS